MKTQTNIWKHWSIYQCPIWDPKSMKIGLLGRSFGLRHDFDGGVNGLKNQVFEFFLFPPIFGTQWSRKPVKTAQHIKLPSVDTYSIIFGNLEQFLALKMAIYNHFNGLKNQNF